MDRIEAQQMGVGLDRAEVVNADHLDVPAAGFGDGPQHIAADAAKSVDCDPDCHSNSPLKVQKSHISADSAGFCGRGLTPWLF
jgi:hypothetical protein